VRKSGGWTSPHARPGSTQQYPRKSPRPADAPPRAAQRPAREPGGNPYRQGRAELQRLSNGEETTNGIIEEIWTPVNNLIYKYSYYPEALAETDSLLKPYTNAEDMYLYFCMWHALMIEAEGQDYERAFMYATGFAQKSGIELTKLWTPQREYTMGAFQAESTTKSKVVLPDDYGTTEYE